MSSDQRNRREFNQLSAAALAGLIAGAAAGCGGKGEGTAAAAEKHLCRGLNDCKGQGAGGANDCRGQGTCATVAEHACGGQNTCKGLGGCGETAGANECKEKGGCHVPLMDGAWKTVRSRLEGKWKTDNAKFGEAPAKAEKKD